MTVLIVILTGIVLIFGFVVIRGAPYVPTLTRQADAALSLLDLKSGQTLLEVGSGDCRVLRAAAKKGLKVVGYELNPILVLISIIVTWKYRKRVTIIWGDYWNAKWPKTDGVYTFLLDKYMKKLDKKIVQEYGKNVKLVSFAFKIPGRKVASEKNGLFLYNY